MVSQITIPDISPAYQSHNPDSDDSSFPSERETSTMGVPHSTRSDSRFSVFSTDSSCNLVEGADHHPPRTALPFYLPSDTHRMVSQQDAGSQPTKCKNRLCRGWRVIVLGSWLNVLLIFIPISWILGIVKPESLGLVFIFCIVSLIPLVKMHDLSTRELAIRIGGSKTGLLNASMSNTVEIVVAISALRKCELRVVQCSLIGSILSKLLLVLGLCFFAGGMRFSEQGFDTTATQIHSSLLSISVCAVLLPAAYHFSLSGDTNGTSEWQKRNILRMSHGVSIVLLFIYACYLIFQLWSHTHLYKDNHKASNRHSVKLPKETLAVFRREKRTERGSQVVDSNNICQMDSGRWNNGLQSTPLTPPPYLDSATGTPYKSRSELTLASPSVDVEKSSNPVDPTVRLVNDSGGTTMSRNESSISGSFNSVSSADSTRDGDLEYLDQRNNYEQVSDTSPQGHGNRAQVKREPQLSWLLTLSSLIVVTIAVAVTADRLVEAMDGISTTISKEWVGLILLPAVSSVAECITAINVSVKDQLTLSISVAVGSTITALFVIPFIVTLAWTMGKPLALLFDPFESLVLYISVQTMSYVVADGKSNWLEGMILVCLYIIIAVSFWFYPGSGLASSLAVCAVTP